MAWISPTIRVRHPERGAAGGESTPSWIETSVADAAHLSAQLRRSRSILIRPRQRPVAGSPLDKPVR